MMHLNALLNADCYILSCRCARALELVFPTKHMFTCLPSIAQLALELLLDILDEMPFTDEMDSARPSQCHRCLGGRIPAIITSIGML